MALTQAEIERIREQQRRAFQSAFLSDWERLRDDVNFSHLVEQIAVGGTAGAIGVIALDRARFRDLEGAIADGFSTGGRATETAIGRIPGRSAPEVVFRFDVRAPQAEAWIRERSSTLVTEIINDQQQLIRVALTRGMEAGVNPRTTALNLVGRVDRVTGRRKGGLLGLTSQQAGFVQSLREELADPERMANYFTRERRDRRFDSIVRRAFEDGVPVDQSDINRISARYSDRLLQLRGENVARTESLNALRAGQHEAVKQGAEEAGVEQSEVIREWDASGDSKTRPDHAAMDGATVSGTEAPFVLPDGSRMMFPGDSSLGASAGQIVNCRCRPRIKVDFIGRALRLEGF